MKTFYYFSFFFILFFIKSIIFFSNFVFCSPKKKNAASPIPISHLKPSATKKSKEKGTIPEVKLKDNKSNSSKSSDKNPGKSNITSRNSNKSIPEKQIKTTSQIQYDDSTLKSLDPKLKKKPKVPANPDSKLPNKSDSKLTADSDSKLTTESDSKLTADSDTKHTKSDSKLTKSDSKLTKSDSKLTKSDSKLTKSDSKLTKSDSKLTTESDSKLTTESDSLHQIGLKPVDSKLRNQNENITTSTNLCDNKSESDIPKETVLIDKSMNHINSEETGNTSSSNADPHNNTSSTPDDNSNGKLPFKFIEIKRCFSVPVSNKSDCTSTVNQQKLDDCVENMQEEICEYIKENIPAKCFRNVKVNIEYDCKKMVTDKVCSEVPVNEVGLCKDTIPKIKKKKCKKKKVEPKCEIVSKDVDDKCAKDVHVDVKYKCSKEKKKKECKSVVKMVPDTCFKNVSYEKEYIYDDIEYIEICEKKVDELIKAYSDRINNESCAQEVVEKKCKPVEKEVNIPCKKNFVERIPYDCHDYITRTLDSTCIMRVPYQSHRNFLGGVEILRTNFEQIHKPRKDYTISEIYDDSEINGISNHFRKMQDANEHNGNENKLFWNYGRLFKNKLNNNDNKSSHKALNNSPGSDNQDKMMLIQSIQNGKPLIKKNLKHNIYKGLKNVAMFDMGEEDQSFNNSVSSEHIKKNKSEYEDGSQINSGKLNYVDFIGRNKKINDVIENGEKVAVQNPLVNEMNNTKPTNNIDSHHKETVDNSFDSTLYQLVEYNCPKEVKVEVPKVCYKDVVKTIWTTCKTVELEEECEFRTVLKENTCDRSLIPEEVSNNIETAQEMICERIPKNVTKIGLVPKSKLEKYECQKPVETEYCIEATTLVDDFLCTKSLLQTEEQPCKKKVFEVQCNNKITDIISECPVQEDVQVEFSCPKVVYKEECSYIPRYENDKCYKDLDKIEEYPCEKEVETLSCKNVSVPFKIPCFRDVEKTEIYPCYKVEYKEECSNFTISEPFDLDSLPLDTMVLSK